MNTQDWVLFWAFVTMTNFFALGTWAFMENGVSFETWFIGNGVMALYYYLKRDGKEE